MKNIVARLFLLTVFCASLLFSGHCLAQSNTVGSGTRTANQNDWPRMLGPDGNSVSAETEIRTDWQSGKLPLKWIWQTGVGYGNCVVADGRVFQFDRFDESERLVCLDSDTGREQWRWDSPVIYRDMYGYNDGPRASPIVHLGYVYVYGVTGKLACLQADSGKLVWQRDINKEFGVVQNFFGVGSTPIAYQDLLWVMIGGSPASSQNVDDGQLHLVKPNGTAMVAFDCRSGKEVYRVGNYLASYSAPIIALIDNADWCLAFVREGLLAFHANDGSNEKFFHWRSDVIESVNAASPVVFGNRIFLSETYGPASVIVEMKDEKLIEVWRDGQSRKEQSFRAHWATPVRVGDLLFGSSGRNEPDSDFRCIELATGKVRWVQRNRQRTTSLFVDNHLVVLGEYGQLSLIRPNPDKWDLVTELDLERIANPKNGQPLLSDPCWAPPVLSNGQLYVRGPKHLVCLELIPPK
jgi:PQQ-like domain